MIDFVSKRVLFYILSLVIVIPGVVSLLLPGGLHKGIAGVKSYIERRRAYLEGELKTLRRSSL